MTRRKTRTNANGLRQLTLRGLGPELEQRLRAVSREERVSLNQAALRLMEKGAGLSERRARLDRIGSGLDAFIGTWSAKQATEVLNATRDFERVDDELWR